MKYIRIHIAVCGALLLVAVPLTLRALNRSLIVDRPVPSDVILVPSGDFALRAGRAIYLAEHGFGDQVLVDEGSETLSFGRTLASRRLHQLPASTVKLRVCPIRTDSTYAESREAVSCLRSLDAHSVLIVTSDFHTRRALSIFRYAMPAATFSVASTPTAFSTQPWWSLGSIRTSTEEWGALIWWSVMQR
jgi:uncharacterized SAM-binding protein YcdF (DUF218 family)